MTLSEEGVMKRMSSVSQDLADVVLQDADEQPQRLGELWAGTPAVLVFVRHFG